METGSDYGPHYLLDALSVRPLAGSEFQSVEVARVLFMPSFHPECCVTVTLDGSEPQVALVTMQTSLWKWYRTLRAEDDRSTEQGLPRVPERWEERSGIPTRRLTVARNEILATQPLSLSDTHRIALDGMTVRGEYRSTDGRTIAFDDWVHPDRGRHHRFVLAIYRLAADLLRDERSIRVLEKIHGYLGLGLPLKCIPGNPLVVRIFGRLTSSDKEPLGDALRRVPLDSPVLMDLSNLDGIARAVCPSFRHLLGRPGPIAWWAPGWLREQLPTVGIPAAQIFTRRLDAVNALRPPRFTRVAPDHSPPAELHQACGNLLRYGRVAAKRQGTEAFRAWREDDGLWIAVFARGLLASGVPAFAAIAGCLIGLAVFLMIRVGSPVHYTGVFLGLLGFLVIAIGGVADGYDQAFRQFEFHVSQAELVVCSFGPFGFRTRRWPRAAIKEVTISLDRLELVFRNRKSRVLLDRARRATRPVGTWLAVELDVPLRYDLQRSRLPKYPANMPCDNLMFRATSLSIFCTDADRSDRFYREVLGAIREPRDGYGCKWYRLGTVSFSLVPNASAASPASFPQHAMPLLRLEVDDVRAVHAHLVKHGVTIIQPPEDRTQIIIADPDGLLIEVWQVDSAEDPNHS